MSTTLSIHFDGQFWVGVLERHDGDSVRAVRVTFGPEPTDAELLAWVQRHGNDLLARLDQATAVPAGSAPPPRAANPKRAQRQASRAARTPRASTAAQEAVRADQEARGRAAAAAGREAREQTADERRQRRRDKAQAKHRGH